MAAHPERRFISDNLKAGAFIDRVLEDPKKKKQALRERQEDLQKLRSMKPSKLTKKQEIQAHRRVLEDLEMQIYCLEQGFESREFERAGIAVKGTRPLPEELRTPVYRVDASCDRFVKDPNSVAVYMPKRVQ